MVCHRCSDKSRQTPLQEYAHNSHHV